MHRSLLILALSALAAACPPAALAQAARPAAKAAAPGAKPATPGAKQGAPGAKPAAAAAPAEDRAARRLESLRGDPGRLYAFLREMPKGADLHNHLGGAIYAESYIRWAAEDGMCVDRKSLEFAAAPCDDATGRASASVALTDGELYRRMVDFLSMRNWQLSGQNGHDWFFGRFGEFPDLPRRRVGDMLAEVKARAAREGVSYLELNFTADTGLGGLLRGKTWWDDDLDRMRERLLSYGYAAGVARGSRDIDEAEARARAVLECDTAAADPGCLVETRYLYQGTRVVPKEYAFPRLLMGFAMAAADPRVVGVNFVSPEDHPVSMQDFPLHMRMFASLRRAYPSVRLSLHAGELAPGLVPPEGLRDHIRQSIEVAGARRIGHGVDIHYEDRSEDLLATMANQGVVVEVCLTSNDVILGVKGRNHPLSAYLAHGVPVVLATDDAGLARSDMTREYLQAALDQGLGYKQLKKMARTSLTHSFLDEFTRARLVKDLDAAYDRFEQSR